jgi:hypothetical protein
LDDGFWYGNQSRMTIGCILPDDNWRFVLFRRDENFRYQRVADGTGYENREGAERSMQNRAVALVDRLAVGVQLGRELASRAGGVQAPDYVTALSGVWDQAVELVLLKAPAAGAFNRKPEALAPALIEAAELS